MSKRKYQQQNQITQNEMDIDQTSLATYKGDYVTTWGWLMFLVSDPNLDQHVCIGLNDGSLLTISFNHNFNQSLKISPGIQEELMTCMKGNKRFVFNLLTIHAHVTHLNALIFDKNFKTLTRFEPHGSGETMYSMSTLDTALRHWLKNVLPEFIYVAPADYCPITGPQILEGLHTWYSSTQGTPLAKQEYCSVWALLFLHSRLLYPNLSNKDIIQKLLTGKNLRNKIQAYATFVLKKVDKRWFRKMFERYQGQMNQSGEAHGKGKLIMHKGKTYEGEFKNDLPHGRGVKSYPDGSTAVGEFQNGCLHGQGKYSHPDDFFYEGAWQQGYYHGFGVYTQHDCKYTGQWFKNSKHGFGELLDYGVHYLGNFYQDKYEGEGVLTDRNGQKYDGRFKAGQFVTGLVTFPDGGTFKGTYEAGRPSVGIYTYKGMSNSIHAADENAFSIEEIKTHMQQQLRRQQQIRIWLSKKLQKPKIKDKIRNNDPEQEQEQEWIPIPFVDDDSQEQRGGYVDLNKLRISSKKN